jgi:predicted phage-related endonuclease
MTDDNSEIDVHPVTEKCWGEERPTLMNASETAAMFGLHDYTTLARVTAAKRGLAGLGPDPESALIRRGHALEDDAIDEIQKLRPTWRISSNTNHYVDHKHRMGAIPDALVTDPDRRGIGVLQIKVVASRIFKSKWPDQTPPLGYLLQLAQEMLLVPHCTWGCVGVLEVGDFEFAAHVYPVERNRQAEERLRNAAAEFWRMFDAGDQPAVDFEKDGDLIALMFPSEVPGKVVDLSTDNAIGELLERREILKDTLKDVSKRLETCETEIKVKLGDAEAALAPGWRLSLKSQHRAAYQVKASSFRVLRATRIRQEAS